MALKEEFLDEDTMDVLKDSFDNVKIKAGMPTNIPEKKLRNYSAPTLVIACKKDCFFPAKKVINRAHRIFSNCRTVELKESGHLHVLPQTEKSGSLNFSTKLSN